MERYTVFREWKNMKIQILPKFVCRFSKILIEIPEIFFCRNQSLILNITWKNKGTRIAKTILKKDKVGEITPPDQVLL